MTIQKARLSMLKRSEVTDSQSRTFLKHSAGGTIHTVRDAEDDEVADVDVDE
jgi:hypothetical protein